MRSKAFWVVIFLVLLGGNVLFADSHVEWFDRGKWSYEFKNGNAK